jgi:two-component system, cell cycle response regulator
MTARILVIEDTWESLELMRVLLKLQGIQVTTAADGKAGVEAALRECPDMILCDILMPEMDGFEVLKRIRSEATIQNTPVVAVTALDKPGDRERILAAGFDGYLSKPITPETFAMQALAYLPEPARMQQQAPDRGRAVPQAGEPASSARSILVVDDLQSNLELAEIALSHLGYDVSLALGMDEGLRRMRRAIPDLVMSDVRMDDGDGFEFVKEVRNDPALRSVPFILITSYPTSAGIHDKAIALGADRFLTRPIAPHALREEIEACVLERNPA